MSEQKEKLKIYAIKTKAGLYLTDRLKSDSWSSSTPLAVLFFDNKRPRPTFHKDWIFVSSEPKKIEKTLPEKIVNIRWERKDIEGAEKLPKVIREEEFEKDVDGYACGHLYKLTQTDFYEKKYDKELPGREKIPFELEIILEIARVKEYKGWSYPILKDNWARVPDATITEKDPRFGLIREMSIPSILLPEGPCALSAEETFAIIRAYVKEHIDPRYAEISSDYRFSFTVYKRIRVAQPIPYTAEEGRGRRKRKVTRYNDYRKSEVLDISTDGKYGEIPIPFRGDDRDDLKRNIDKFLKDLIKKINEPIVECAKCIGAGVVVEKIKIGAGAEEGGAK